MYNIKKIIAIIWLTFLLSSNIFTSFAASQIGTWSIVWDSGSDTSIIWDDNLPWTATGVLNWVIVTAKVLPTLNMEISTWSIDLWTLIPWITFSGSVEIEVWTNASNWVTITARSWSWWLTNLNDNSIQINNLNTDWVTESYSFESFSLLKDSTIPTFTSNWDLVKSEVNNTSTEHVIYNTDNPERIDATNADLIFNVATITDTQTMAGDYKDNITFTVTWNF